MTDLIYLNSVGLRPQNKPNYTHFQKTVHILFFALSADYTPTKTTTRETSKEFEVTKLFVTLLRVTKEDQVVELKYIKY